MINESELQETLIILVAFCKKTFDFSLQTLNELAAVRESVRGLDPTFSDVLSGHRKYYTESERATADQILEDYDDLSRRLRDHLIL
jgi:hypothetical protein